MFLSGSSGWIQAHETPSELEKITEGLNTGWRLLGYNQNNFGNIEQNAVDLSVSPFTGTNYGATGEGAFAAATSTSATEANAVSMGNFSVASGQASTALGYDARKELKQEIRILHQKVGISAQLVDE